MTSHVLVKSGIVDVSFTTNAANTFPCHILFCRSEIFNISHRYRNRRYRHHQYVSFNSLSSSSVCVCKCSSSIDFFENLKLHIKHSRSAKQYRQLISIFIVNVACYFQLTTYISLDCFIDCCCHYCNAHILWICTAGMNINLNSQEEKIAIFRRLFLYDDLSRDDTYTDVDIISYCQHNYFRILHKHGI